MPDVIPVIVEAPARQRSVFRSFLMYQAWFFVLVAIIGFAPSAFKFFAGKMSLPWTVHVHGVVMMAWMLGYAAQTTFAARGDLTSHRVWGARLTWLAGAVLFVMALAVAGLLRRFDPSLTHMPTLYDVFAIQMVSIVWFAVFVTWGLLARASAEWHRRLMTFGTLVLLQAAADRMDWLPDESVPMYWRSAFRLYAVMTPMIAFDLLTLRRLHPATLSCAAIVFVGHVFVSTVWGDDSWRMFVHNLTQAWR